MQVQECSHKEGDQLSSFAWDVPAFKTVIPLSRETLAPGKEGPRESRGLASGICKIPEGQIT